MKITTAKGWGPVLVQAPLPAYSQCTTGPFGKAVGRSSPSHRFSVGSYTAQPGVSGNLAITGSDTSTANNGQACRRL